MKTWFTLTSCMVASAGLLVIGGISWKHIRPAALVASDSNITADPRILNLGEVWPRQPIVEHFSLVNHGQLPATIVTIKSDCGCAAAIPRSNNLGPGEKVDVQVTFIPPDISKSGATPVERSITSVIEIAGRRETLQTKVDAKVIPNTILRGFPVRVDASLLKNVETADFSIFLEGAIATLDSIPDNITIDAGESRDINIMRPSGSEQGMATKYKDLRITIRNLCSQKKEHWISEVNLRCSGQKNGLVIQFISTS